MMYLSVNFKLTGQEFCLAQSNSKQLLDEVFVISRIIEVEVRVISRSWRLRLITLNETSIILDITKTESNNCFIIQWAEKNWSHVFASSLTASSTKCANLTWLLLEIMRCGHTWLDYPWPWVSFTWLLYNLQLWRHKRWFRKFTVCFWPITKGIASSMFNNRNYYSICWSLSFPTIHLVWNLKEFEYWYIRWQIHTAITRHIMSRARACPGFTLYTQKGFDIILQFTGIIDLTLSMICYSV